jgi:hypothetical protein
LKWFRRGPSDLTLSNEYQQLTRGGCINCGALYEVLKAEDISNWKALHDILNKVPADTSYSGEGCWAYLDDPQYYPACLGGLLDDDPKVIHARDEIVRARQAIKDCAQRQSKEHAKKLRDIQKRRLP